MLALAGLPLGLRFTFLEPLVDAAAADVGRQLVGAYDDQSLLRRLGEESDLVTFEFESVPESSADLLAQSGSVFPPPRALAVGQDRLLEKQLFQSLGVETASYREVDSPSELAAAADVGLPALLKTRRLGYDGHGQRLVLESGQLEAAWRELDEVPAILERVVPFDRELSSSACGEGRRGCRYPLVENHHQEGILRLTLAPAPALSPELQQQAARIGALILEELLTWGCWRWSCSRWKDDCWPTRSPRGCTTRGTGRWTGQPAVSSRTTFEGGLGWPLGGTWSWVTRRCSTSWARSPSRLRS